MHCYKIINTLLLGSMLASSAHLPAETFSEFIQNNTKWIYGAVIAATGFFGWKKATAWHKAKNDEQFERLHWDWQEIRSHDIDKQPTIDGKPLGQFFKEHAQSLKNKTENRTPTQNQWLWGTATSAHQVESGCTNNQWNLFENKEMGKKLIEAIGDGCDSQNHEEEDIKLMVSLGANCYRFSIDWGKIYPNEGQIDRIALGRYVTFCQNLIKHGIKPVITLYHYAEPIWFYNKGGFEKAENIKYFVEFCSEVYTALNPYVYLWLTFNSPEGIAAQGWLTGTKPPAKEKQYKLMAQVLYNLLEAHVQVYRTCKMIDSHSRIGILKNIMQLDPWDPCNPLDVLACKIGTDLVDTSIYHYFKTGEFKIKIPFKVNFNPPVNNFIKDGGKCHDFIGLNYYCHNYMKMFKTIREPNPLIEIPTNNDKYTIYAEGLYRAIEELSTQLAQPLGIPIYITENGIGTDNDDHRVLHNQNYLYAMAKAIKDGFDVRGYMHWSLMDNYEWGQYNKHYGLISIDRNTKDYKREKKKSAWYFEKVAKATFA